MHLIAVWTYFGSLC